jgi:hypothetical protein
MVIKKLIQIKLLTGITTTIAMVILSLAATHENQLQRTLSGGM